MSVVSLAEKRVERAPHLSGAAKCLGCAHEWAAVAPVGATELECPQCRLMKGRFAYLVSADETWHCNCGNDLFRIRSDAVVYCPNCGDHQVGWFA